MEFGIKVSCEKKIFQIVLDNPKDKTGDFEKSGIYGIHVMNGQSLIDGQNRRTIKTRYEDHLDNTKYA